MIEPNRQLIESGQGAAVFQSKTQEWKSVVAKTFEMQARVHATQLVASGILDHEMLIGPWWTNRPEQVELDVVGVSKGRWKLVGEAKWSERFGQSELRRFERNLAKCGDRAEQAQRHLWLKSAPDGPLEHSLGSYVIHRPLDMLWTVEQLRSHSG